MSQPRDSQQEHTDANVDPVKPSKSLFILSILVVIGLIVLIMQVEWKSPQTRATSESDLLGNEALASRIAPVARIELIVVSADREPQTGEQVYDIVCAACHSTGVAGAPKFGDQGQWAPYIATGFDEMLLVATNGKGAMPPRGGNPNLSDLELARAVVFMANASGANFEEPAGEAAGEAASSTAEETPAADASAAASSDTAETVAVSEATETAPATAVDQSETIDLAKGESIYKQACFACHAAGIAGAPKFGSKEAWAPYIATGMDAMLAVVISGKGAMPPRGGLTSASDDDLRSAVAYMVDHAR